jgi:CDP-paratose 2-epimerase
VAWFGIRALQDLSIAIYGDGKQVRDVLFIEDLIEAYDKAIDAISRTAGQAYNIGGGPSNTLSLLELIELLQEHLGRRVGYSLHDWRPGDQLVFVSDVRKAKRDFGWEPKTNVQNGVESLLDWLKRHESAICETLSLV